MLSWIVVVTYILNRKKTNASHTEKKTLRLRFIHFRISSTDFCLSILLTDAANFFCTKKKKHTTSAETSSRRCFFYRFHSVIEVGKKRTISVLWVISGGRWKQARIYRQQSSMAFKNYSNDETYTQTSNRTDKNIRLRSRDVCCCCFFFRWVHFYHIQNTTLKFVFFRFRQGTGSLPATENMFMFVKFEERGKFNVFSQANVSIFVCVCLYVFKLVESLPFNAVFMCMLIKIYCSNLTFFSDAHTVQIDSQLYS